MGLNTQIIKETQPTLTRFGKIILHRAIKSKSPSATLCRRLRTKYGTE